MSHSPRLPQNLFFAGKTNLKEKRPDEEISFFSPCFASVHSFLVFQIYFQLELSFWFSFDEFSFTFIVFTSERTNFPNPTLFIRGCLSRQTGQGWKYVDDTQGMRQMAQLKLWKTSWSSSPCRLARFVLERGKSKPFGKLSSFLIEELIYTEASIVDASFAPTVEIESRSSSSLLLTSLRWGF